MVAGAQRESRRMINQYDFPALFILNEFAQSQCRAVAIDSISPPGKFVLKLAVGRLVRNVDVAK